jgi:predicted nucleic acid-binding protein
LPDRLRAERGHVPALWELEVANILAGAERRRRITQARTVEFLAILGDLVPLATKDRALARAAHALRVGSLAA